MKFTLGKVESVKLLKCSICQEEVYRCDTCDDYPREEQADDWYYFDCGNCGDERQLDEDEYNEMDDYLNETA